LNPEKRLWRFSGFFFPASTKLACVRSQGRKIPIGCGADYGIQWLLLPP
jgi:hypothetical protein